MHYLMSMICVKWEAFGKKIPYTYALMWIGSLALAGVWPFAGFFSKDIILEAAYASHTEFGQFAFWLGIIAAFLTAFYSWRLLFMVFHGKPRASEEIMQNVHESPRIILVPLIVLATGAVFVGAIGYYGFDMVDAAGTFWKDSLLVLGEPNILEKAHHVELWVKYLPLAVGAAGIFIAFLTYIILPSVPGFIAKIFKPLYAFSLNKWYFDELYEILFVKPSKWLGAIFMESVRYTYY